MLNCNTWGVKVSNGGQRVSTILFFLALFAVIGIFYAGLGTIVHRRVGFDFVMLASSGALAFCAIWGLRILFKGAWRMATDEENRRLNGIQGALGLILGILFCGMVLWVSMKAAFNLLRSL